MRNPDIGILGASVRAAAQSAIRSGFTPWCADLFCDADLRKLVPDAVQCPLADYPNNFRTILNHAPNVPWFYTGGLENEPDLIEQLSTLRPLWGNDGDTLRRVRDPFFVAQVLERAGCATLRVCQTPVQTTGQWVWKPLHGSAGQGIHLVVPTSVPLADGYYQEYMAGTPMSGVFVASATMVFSLGYTQQLIGTAWLNAAGFRYAGNIGPISLANEPSCALQRVAQVVADACQLRGLFGIDFVLAGNVPYVVEINPRYTASLEVLEHANLAFPPIIQWHRRACTVANATLSFPKYVSAAPVVVGKAILYAKEQTIINEHRWNRLQLVTHIADVPKQGDIIAPGWPILTAFGYAPTADECEQYLRMRADELYALLDA